MVKKKKKKLKLVEICGGMTMHYLPSQMLQRSGDICVHSNDNGGHILTSYDVTPTAAKLTDNNLQCSMLIQEVSNLKNNVLIFQSCSGFTIKDTVGKQLLMTCSK